MSAEAELAAEALAWGPLVPDAWLFPGEGVHAPGPLGQQEQPDFLERAWASMVPRSRAIQYVRVQANDPDNPFLPRDTRVWCDGPKLCRLLSATGSLAGSAWSITVSPERQDAQNILAFSGWQGVPTSRDTFLLPSAGSWIIRCTAIGVTSGFAVFAMLDVSNEGALLPLFPRFTTNNIIGQADLAIGAGSSTLMTALVAHAHTSLQVINTNAAAIRVGWGGASATEGILLAPTGSPHDRHRFTTRDFAIAELGVWKLTAGTVSVIRFQ